MIASRVVSTIVCEANRTTCISHDGNLFCFGESNVGAHGYDERVSPIRKIPSLYNICLVSCGTDHTVCLNFNGDVFSFGKNQYGQLGVGKDILEFTHIPQTVNLPAIKQLSCEMSSTICVSDNGDVFAFGKPLLGDECYFTPVRIESLKDIDFVECGGEHTFVKDYHGDVFCLGHIGSMGVIQTIPPYKCENWPKDIVDIKCGDFHALVLTSKKEVYSIGDNGSGQLGRQGNPGALMKIPNLSEIIRIECGYFYSLCIDVFNDLYVFGINNFGQLGINKLNSVKEPTKHPSLSNVIDISYKGYSTFVKTSNNQIYAFGKNNFSQLGTEATSDKQLTPIQVFIEQEDIWCSDVYKPKAKSARK